MAGGGTQYVVRVEDGASFEVQGEKGDITFPEQVRGWGDVLDCRHAPYTNKRPEELLRYAKHVHKFFILVYEDKLPTPA
jgi:hypothetical protein